VPKHVLDSSSICWKECRVDGNIINITYFDGGSYGLIEVLSRNSRGDNENHEKAVETTDVPSEIQTRHFPHTNYSITAIPTRTI
jgi:hypothetical protein